MNTIAIILAVLILIVLIGLFLGTRKKSANYYFSKAEKSHKKSEHYHNIGDEELAQEYSEEATHYRHKAEEIQHDVVPTA